MKKTYIIPQTRQVALASTSFLANSWSPDSRSVIDNNPQEQDVYGVKGSIADDDDVWLLQ